MPALVALTNSRSKYCCCHFPFYCCNKDFERESLRLVSLANLLFDLSRKEKWNCPLSKSPLSQILLESLFSSLLQSSLLETKFIVIRLLTKNIYISLTVKRNILNHCSMHASMAKMKWQDKPFRILKDGENYIKIFTLQPCRGIPSR